MSQPAASRHWDLPLACALKLLRAGTRKKGSQECIANIPPVFYSTRCIAQLPDAQSACLLEMMIRWVADKVKDLSHWASDKAGRASSQVSQNSPAPRKPISHIAAFPGRALYVKGQRAGFLIGRGLRCCYTPRRLHVREVSSTRA